MQAAKKSRAMVDPALVIAGSGQLVNIKLFPVIP
jgi:hypothetical protein